MNSIQGLIKDICEEEGISFQLLSNDWIICLEKDNQVHYIAGSKFDLNNYVSARICNDKYACFSALQYHNIPVCLHHIFYKEDDESDIKKYYEECNRDVVVKANGGSFGDEVYHVTDFNKLLQTMDLLFEHNHSLSICPYYHILKEYRVIVLNNHVELIFGKERPVVTGDGVHSIYELLLSFNKPYFSKVKDSSLERVLDAGEVFEYSWQHNLSKGAIPVPVKDLELVENLSKIAVEATTKLNLGFVSVDIVELEDHSLKVLEINSGVITNISDYFEDGETIAKELYRKAVLSMFEK